MEGCVVDDSPGKMAAAADNQDGCRPLHQRKGLFNEEGRLEHGLWVELRTFMLVDE